MQKNIRQCIFETNSSSTHVIVIDQEDVKHKNELHLPIIWDDAYIGEYFVLYLNSYGWSFEWLDYPQAKLGYLMTYAIQGLPISTEDELNEVLSNIWKNETSEYSSSYNDLIDLVDFIKEYDVNASNVQGIKVRFEYSDELPYIDHQSYGGSIEHLLNWKGHGMSMAEFVFNPAVRMRISNDNQEDEELEEALRNSRYAVSEDRIEYADN